MPVVNVDIVLQTADIILKQFTSLSPSPQTLCLKYFAILRQFYGFVFDIFRGQKIILNLPFWANQFE